MSYANNKKIDRNTNSGNFFQKKEVQKFSSLSNCIDRLKVEWLKNKSIAALWKDWPRVAGKSLAMHCMPLNFQGGVLTVGANHPQWIQALVFNRNQLIAALRAEGHEVKDLRIQHHYPQEIEPKDNETFVWDKHPSRVDVYGKKTCPNCNSPSPIGEISLWGKCGLCRRNELTK